MTTKDINRQALSVSVVICTHNRPVQLERCLQALRGMSQPVFSLHIIDNARDSDAAESLAARYGAEYWLSPVKGVSRARNLGARFAQGEIIAYIDDDMVPHADWLSRLLEEFTDENIMAVTGPVLPLTLVDANDVELQQALKSSSWGPNRFQLDSFSTQWFERTNFGGIGDGNMTFRSTAFQYFQGFDERLGRGAVISSGEEHYAFFRLVNEGFRIAYTPNAIVYHANAALTRQYRQCALSEAIAYIAFLFWRHPKFSWRLIKFVIEGVFRKKQPWRNQSSDNNNALSLIEISSAAFSAMNMFWRARTISNASDVNSEPTDKSIPPRN